MSTYLPGDRAPSNSQYITLATDTNLDNERVLTPGTGISGTDGGAGSTYTIALDGTLVLDVKSKTAAYTATTSENVILCDASGGAFTVTLPAASGNSGLKYTIKKTDSSTNAVTVDGDGTETIDGSTTFILHSQYYHVSIVCDGSNWHII